MGTILVSNKLYNTVTFCFNCTDNLALIFFFFFKASVLFINERKHCILRSFNLKSVLITFTFCYNTFLLLNSKTKHIIAIVLPAYP